MNVATKEMSYIQSRVGYWEKGSSILKSCERIEIFIKGGGVTPSEGGGAKRTQ